MSWLKMRRKLQVKDEHWSEPSAHQGEGRVGVDDSVGDNLYVDVDPSRDINRASVTLKTLCLKSIW